MGADLVLLANKSDIHVADLIAFFMGEGGGMPREDMALGGFPLSIRGREMSPDIALCQRTIDCVAERMQADIGVGVPLKPARVWYGDAAKHDMISGAKAM